MGHDILNKMFKKHYIYIYIYMHTQRNNGSNVELTVDKTSEEMVHSLYQFCNLSISLKLFQTEALKNKIREYQIFGG